MKPDWKNAPEWAEWLAQDLNGWWYWYEYKPSVANSGFLLHGGAFHSICGNIYNKCDDDIQLVYNQIEYERTRAWIESQRDKDLSITIFDSLSYYYQTIINYIVESKKGGGMQSQQPNFEDITCGIHMTLEKWLETVRCGGFIDYDGSGELATADKVSGINIYPSQAENYIFPDWCTHIVWFNK